MIKGRLIVFVAYKAGKSIGRSLSLGANYYESPENGAHGKLQIEKCYTADCLLIFRVAGGRV